MTYKIENLDEIVLYGVKIFIDENASKNNEIQKNWELFIKNSELKGSSYGISVNYDRETHNFDYIIAAKKESIKDNNYSEYTIPQGKYAKFSFQGITDQKSILDFYDRSFKELHKENLYDDTRGINSYEYYNEEYTNINDPKSIMYLLLPIK